MVTKGQKRSKIVPATKVSIVKIDSKRSKQIRHKILSLKNSIETSYFELAELLYETYVNRYYEEWGYESFEEYCKKELEFGERKGRYLVSVWYHLVIEKQFTDKELNKLKNVGWTKLRALVRVVDTSNVDEWIELAKTMTVDELDIKTKQAVFEKMVSKEVCEGEIVQEIKRFSCVLVDDQIKVVEKAFEIAEKIAKSNKRGNLLTLICLDFLSTKAGEDLELSEFISQTLQKLSDHNKA